MKELEADDQGAQQHRMQLVQGAGVVARLHNRLHDLPHRKKLAPANLVGPVDSRRIVKRPHDRRHQVFHPQGLDHRA